MTETNRQGDTYDLQLKIHKYKGMLYKIALMQLKNTQDAEDVVQEVFCQYFRKEQKFESEEHEKAWFIKVTLNACRKIWRSAWYRHRSDMPEQDYAAESKMENEYLKKEQRRELLQAVMDLPIKYREVIHLFYYEDLSINEISTVTGRQQSTITSQLTRGRELLKKCLKEGYYFEQL